MPKQSLTLNQLCFIMSCHQTNCIKTLIQILFNTCSLCLCREKDKFVKKIQIQLLSLGSYVVYANGKSPDELVPSNILRLSWAEEVMLRVCMCLFVSFSSSLYGCMHLYEEISVNVSLHLWNNPSAFQVVAFHRIYL